MSVRLVASMSANIGHFRPFRPSTVASPLLASPPLASPPLASLRSSTPRTLRTFRLAASNNDNPAPSSRTIGNVGIWAIWLALGSYAAFFAPNLTPLRDSYFLEKAIGLGTNDGVALNSIFMSLFNIMGVWPAIYAALLIPGGRSSNKIPAWPFVTGSFALGAFALLPFMALWQPMEDYSTDATYPPARDEWDGWKGKLLASLESPFTPLVLLLVSLYQIYTVATADGAQWIAFGHLLDESKFTHVMTIDFLTLTGLAPFWMSNDASVREWDKKDTLVPVLSFLPVLGPIVYLMLRPKLTRD